MLTTAATHATPQLPMWPFILLIVLLLMGLSFSRERLVAPRVVALVPMLMAIVSLSAVRSAFGLLPQTAGGWLLGLAAAAAITVVGRFPRGVTWDARARRLRVPGSWMPLVLFIGIFASRFAVGTAQALHSPVLQDAVFVVSMSILYGTFTGIFLGRAIVTYRAVPAGTARLTASPELTAATPRP